MTYVTELGDSRALDNLGYFHGGDSRGTTGYSKPDREPSTIIVSDEL